jgi:hypothetical protein
MIKFPVLCALSVLAMAMPAVAQRVETGSPPDRESTLVVFGDDPCPQSSEEEIVVCARRPEEERYRIPAPLRQTEPTEVAWGARVADLEDASRVGRPNSCSTVGIYGQGGCTQQLIRQWYDERRSRRTQP